MDNTKNTPPTAGKPIDDKYFPGDPIPVPEAVETDTDSAWALWQDSVQPREKADSQFADTDLLDIHPTPPEKKP